MLKKILIVFDTNKIRQGDRDGDSEYSRFCFVGDFKDVLDYINKRKLEDYISIAIPEICVEEIKKQKIESYEGDLDFLENFKKRAEGIDKITVLSEVEEGFDINSHLAELANDYLRTNKNINILKIKEEKYLEIFRSIMKRAIKKDPPFKKTSNNVSDAGFKDVVVWETVLNSELVNNFDEVIFLSNDGDFSRCKNEFEERLNKYCKVIKETTDLLVDLDKEYEDFDVLKEFMAFAENNYFFQLLIENVEAGNYVLESEDDIDIISITISRAMTNVEIVKGRDENTIIVSSEIVINPGTDYLPFKALTTLSEEKEIIEIHLSKL
jgi:hypothetical protein